MTRCPVVFTYLSVQNFPLLFVLLESLYTTVTRVNSRYIASPVINWRLGITSIIKHFHRGSHCIVKLSETNPISCLIFAARNLLVSFYFYCCCCVNHFAINPGKLCLELIFLLAKSIFTVAQKHRH